MCAQNERAEMLTLCMISHRWHWSSDCFFVHDFQLCRFEKNDQPLCTSRECVLNVKRKKVFAFCISPLSMLFPSYFTSDIIWYFNETSFDISVIFLHLSLAFSLDLLSAHLWLFIFGFSFYLHNSSIWIGALSLLFFVYLNSASYWRLFNEEKEKEKE